VLERLDLEAGGYVLATVHRAENTDRTDRLVSIMEGLGQVAATLSVVVPLHPRTRVACEQAGVDPSALGLTVVEPLGYLDMVELERNARVIATDSGGVQKEAYFHGVPCVTLRDETEWVELVEAGVNVLVGAVADDIVTAVLDRPPVGSRVVGLYGRGDAAERIVAILRRTTATT